MDGAVVKQGPTAAEWDAHKALIQSLYLNREMQPSQLIDELARRGFIVTQAQLIYKLKLWKFQRNLSSKEWKYVGHRLQKRKRDGKESDVLVSGARFKRAKVDRGIYRNSTTSLASKFQSPLSPEPPDMANSAISICTPPALKMEFRTWPNTLPWIQFQLNTQTLFASLPVFSQNNRESQVAAGGQLGFEGLRLFPHTSLAQQSPSQAAAVIGSVMPEAYDGENVARASALISGSTRDAFAETLRILIYRISNGTRDNPQLITAFVQLFERVGANRMPLLGGSPSMPIGGHTLPAFAENLFSGCIFEILELWWTSQELPATYEVLRWLLRSGYRYNIDQPLRKSLTLPRHLIGSRATPTQFAAVVGSVSLLDLLIQFGANLDLTTMEEPRTPLEIILEETKDAADKEILARMLLSAGAGRQANNLVRPLFQAIQSGLVCVIELLGGLGVTFDASLPSDTCLWERDDVLKMAALYLPPPNSGPPAWFFHQILATIPEVSRHRFLNAAPDTHAEVLVAAAWAQNTDVLRYIVALGGNLRLANKRGVTPLLAVILGRSIWSTDLSCLRYHLQELGHAVHGSEESSVMAFHIAASRGDDDTLKCLLAAGFDANTVMDPRALSRDHRYIIQGCCGPDHTVHEMNRLTFRCRVLKCRYITPLMMMKLASSYCGVNYYKCMDLLISHGAVLQGGEVIAAVKGQEDNLLKTVLDAGGDPNERDSEGLSCLTVATRLWEDDPTAILYLVDAGAVFGRKEITELYRLPPTTHLDEIRSRLLMDDSIWASMVGSQNYDMLTRLEAAIYSKDAKTIDWVMQRSNPVYNPGALCAAVQMAVRADLETWEVSFVKTILGYRRNDAEGDTLESTAFLIAMAAKDHSLINLLFSHIQPSTFNVFVPEGLRHNSTIDSWVLNIGFWRSDSRESMHILKPLYLYWPDGLRDESLSRRFPPDRTVLSEIARKDDLECLEKILEAYSIIQHPLPTNLESPLVFAVKGRNLRMVQLLIQHGESVNEEPNGGGRANRTAIQAAVEEGYLEIIDFLLQSGADVNGKPAIDGGATALQLAAIKGFVGIAMLLLEHEPPADINAAPAPINGRTALEGAAEWGRIDMIQLLLSYGVETTGAGQRQFLRAIWFAERMSFTDAASILREHRELTDLELSMLADDSTLFPEEIPTELSDSSSESCSEFECESEDDIASSEVSSSGEATTSDPIPAFEAEGDAGLVTGSSGGQLTSEHGIAEDKIWDWIDSDFLVE